MVIQSHNSWSYLAPKKWWMYLIRFTSKCQSKTIKQQYNDYDTKSFDIRVRFDKYGNLIMAHGIVEFSYSYDDLMKDLEYLNEKGNIIIRVLYEVRTKKDYETLDKNYFINFCKEIESKFKNIVFYAGRNLYDSRVEYDFGNNITDEGKYSSVCNPKLIDDWFPWLYARFHNKKNIEIGTDKDVLSIDFVNIR